MVAEVEAMRKSVEEERQRLADRCADLDREKRQAGAAARAESDRLTEQVNIHVAQVAAMVIVVLLFHSAIAVLWVLRNNLSRQCSLTSERA